MIEYNCSDIVKFDRIGILLYDGYLIEFEKCKKEWAKENKININETKCVGIRFLDKKNKYFIFYTHEKIKINFVYKGIFNKKKSSRMFCEMQLLLNEFGYTSYDLT